MKRSVPWHVGVLIPARNEEDLLPRCLQSILAAKAEISKSASTDIVLVDDGSADRTSEIAWEMLRGHGTVVSICAESVGAARRMATQLLINRYYGPLSRCWLAHTDADCMVPTNWLVDQLALADCGIEAVAGTVSVDSFDEHGPEVPARFRATYLIEPNGRHPHVHGANLGIRADSYFRAGGWSKLNTAEDHDLWRRLTATGARQHSTCRVEVQTSGRRIGRAPHGFADALAAHNETAA